MTDLGPNVNVGALAVKVGLSALGPVGAIVGELVAEHMPNYRMERLEACVLAIQAHLADVDPDFVRKRVNEPILADLVDDGLRSSARASSADRIAQIARLIADGVRGGDIRVQDRRFILKTLDELNDIEVLLLQSKAMDYADGTERQEFREKHRDALHRPSAHLGENPPGVVEGEAVGNAYELHLERLGLLERKSHTFRLSRSRTGDRDRAIAEAVESMAKHLAERSPHYWLSPTSFGRVFLRAVGLRDGLEAVRRRNAGKASGEGGKTQS